MKKSFLTLNAIMLLGLVSCTNSGINEENKPGETTDENENEENEPIVDSGEISNPPSDLYKEFYALTSDLSITLDFTNEAIYKLAKYSSDEVKKEMYHPCNITFTLNGESYTFLEAGARMKGNTSRNENFVDENGTFSAPVHFKISLKETFDDEEDNDYYIREWASKDERSERKDREFADQQKFDIKYNKNEDMTNTKQIYAYHAFNEEGLMASNITLAKVTVKSETDEFTEIYQLQETIDKDFLKKRLSKEASKGNLYKSTYTDMGPASLKYDSINRIGVEGPNYHPSYDLKTNDDPDEIDHSLLKNVITTLSANKSSAEEFKPILDDLVDVDAILKYQAMCWVIGNPDDSRNNYNNYYIYFNSVTNKMCFIPYDFDRCLGIMKDWEVHLEDVPYYTTKRRMENDRPWQENPLLWRMIISENDNSVNYSDDYPVISEYQEKYKNYCIEYANKYLDNDKFIEFTNQFVYATKNYSSGGANNLTFNDYATKKLGTL